MDRRKKAGALAAVFAGAQAALLAAMAFGRPRRDRGPDGKSPKSDKKR